MSRRLRPRARWLAGVLPAVLVATCLVASPASAAPGSGTVTPGDPVLPVKEFKPDVPPFPKMTPLTTKPVVWPNAAVATLPVASRRDAPAPAVGGLPVAVEPVAADDTPGVTSAAPGQVRVEVVSHEQSMRAGYPVAMRLSNTDSSDGGRVRVTVSYAGFRDAYGADWDNRLTLMQVTPCALTTPTVPNCSQATPLVTVNDYSSGTVSAVVDVTKVTQTRVLSPKQAALEGVPESTVTSEPVVLGIMASGSSDIGDYTKTDYHPDFSWQAGSNSGDFSLSYPIATPPVPAALAPEVTLSYSSGAVDGQTVGVNVQPFWGEGWSYAPGYVERAYRACKDEVANSPKYTITTPDNCFRLPNARMLLGGRSVELILGNDGVWRAENDDVAKVELLTGGTGTGLYNNERWKVSTVDGTVYYFGLTRLPGWTAGDRETNAALGMPVYSNHNGDPCIDAQGVGWTTSWCQMAYRWNLDYVVDRNGNTMSFWYTRETNKTALAGNASYVTTYDRFGLLDHIEYGTRGGTGATREPRPGATPPAKVVFGYSDRCITASCGTHDRANHPDTPWDLDCGGASCANNLTPSFWSTRRASQIATEVYSGSGTIYNRVDEWALGAEFPIDASGSPLWLSSITHTGKVGGSQALPSLQFYGTRFRNRADWDPNGTMADPQKYRITSVRNETGGQIDVTYDAQDPGCQFGSPFPDPDNNYFRCFARRWVNPTGDLGWAWWHKYVVKTVVEKDLVGGSPDKTTNYAYDLAGAGSTTGPVVLWAYDKGGSVFATSTGFRSWADWRGYPTVVTTVGTVTGQQSQTRNLYFRGLNEDRTDNGYYARNATVTNSLGEVTNDEPTYAGMVYESQTLAGPSGQVLTKTITDPARYLTGTRDMTNSWSIPPSQWSYITRPTRERQMTWLPNSSSWRTTDKTTTWNTTYGVVDTVNDLGGPGTGDDLCTRHSFTFPAVGAPYLAQFPNRVQTVGVACTATPVYPQDAVSDTRSFYDGATSSTTAPISGNVTKVESAVSYTGSTPNYVKRQTMSYDAWGRVTSVKDGLDHQTTTVYNQNATGLTATVTVTNALSHDATTTLDVNRGAPLTVSDANDKVTTLTYDPLGRLLKVWRPGHPTSGTPDSEYQYTLQATGPSYIRTRTLGPNGNQIDSYDIYDGLLRPRQRQSTAPSGKRVVNETLYDRRGLTEKSSIYYDSANPPLSTLATLADTSIDQQTRNVYDNAGRLTASELWSRNVLQWRTATSYFGDRTTVDQPLGGTDTTTVIDARGRTTELRQYHSFADYPELVANDYNNDGKMDMFAIQPGTGRRVVFYGNGNNTFLPSTSFTSNGWDTLRNWVGGKFDADANMDAIGIRKTDGALIRYQGDGAGSLTTPTQVGSGFDVYSALTASDFNNDGYTDLVAIRASDSHLLYYQAPSGGGTFANPVDLGGGWDGLVHLVSGDANGDGKADLLAVRSSDTMLRRWLGNGNGTFAAGTDLLTGWRRANLVARDFNGDGKLDLFGAFPQGEGDPTLKRWSGDGTTFTSIGSLPPMAGQAFDKSTYSYDHQGKLVAYTDPAGNQSTFTFDLLGRKKTATHPDAGTTTYGYDNGDRQTTVQDARNVVLAYTYDDLNRKTGVFEGTLAGVKRAEWVYDSVAKGHVTAASRFDGGNTYSNTIGSYDDSYQPLSVTMSVPGFGAGGGSLTYTTTNTYKTNGALASIEMPAVGGLPAETLTNAYSDQGMPTTTTGLASYISGTSFSFDGLVTQQLLGASGSQVKLTATYDTVTRQLTNQSVATETATVDTFTTKYSTDYGYDQTGNITFAAGKTHNGTALAADQQECFRYDGLRRLREAWTQTSGTCTTAQRTGADPYWRQWTFDLIGNRITQTDKDTAGDTTWSNTIAGTACGTAAKPHQVTAISANGPKADTASRSFCYDAAGNTTSRTSSTGAAQTLTWDKEGHVATLVEGANTTSYIYDADGKRLIARTPSKSILYLNDGTELELPTGGGAALATRYYSGVAVRDASGLKWTVANHQGSGTVQIDSVTLSSSRRRFMPYGEDRTATPGGWIGSKGYVGGTKDNTGLTHLGAREYDPTMGRFVTTDPVVDTADPQQWNAYTYSNGNPVTFDDPDGNIICGDEGCHQVATVNPSGGYYVSGKPQSYVAPCAPNCKPPKPPTKQQQEWIDKYNQAIDNAIKNHKEMAGATGLDKLASDPSRASGDILDRYETIVEYEFCQLVPDCLNAFKYFWTVSAVVWVTGANGSPVDDNESANLVRNAVDRQLARGWDTLLKEMSPAQQRAYQEAIDDGQYWKARMFAGTALHDATARDLRQADPDRWEYFSNKNPDWLDRKTGSRVELTTRLGRVAHVARGIWNPLYRQATYVLYKSPGSLPSIRGGSGGGGPAPAPNNLLE